MGKNNKKDKKRKDQSVFKVAGARVHKSKSKTKPVTTKLQKMRIREQTEQVDAALRSLGQDVMKKPAAKQQQLSSTKPKLYKAPQQPTKPMDMEATVEEFAKL